MVFWRLVSRKDPWQESCRIIKFLTMEAQTGRVDQKFW